jgi:hypothetical protein
MEEKNRWDILQYQNLLSRTEEYELLEEKLQ